MYDELSIIIPARNEAASILKILKRLRHNFPDAELIVVDNGSTDQTGSIAATQTDVVVVREERMGKGNAMRCGAKAASRPVIMFHDADIEYRVEDARSVVDDVIKAPHEERGCIMSIGVRAWRLHWLPFVSFAVNNLIRTIFLAQFGSAPEDVLTGTRCLTRDTFLNMDTRSQTFAIETEISRIALKTDMKIPSNPVRYTPRKHSEGKKINWKHLPAIIMAAITSGRPQHSLAKSRADAFNIEGENV